MLISIILPEDIVQYWTGWVVLISTEGVSLAESWGQLVSSPVLAVYAVGQ